jgi:autotransporter-associated beta strand protein
MNSLRQAGIVAICLCLGGPAFGSGGGENMLLVVNPNDPASLQIANAYAALRDIPANNILFLAPPPDYNNAGSAIAQSEVIPNYLTPISNAIASRGLGNQINYIGTIGEAVSYSITADSGLSYTSANSLSYALELLTPLTNGSGLTLQGAVSHLNPVTSTLYAATSGLYQNPAMIPINGAADAAIQHSASYSVTYYPSGGGIGTTYTTQYYMAGAIGYTGTNGNTVAQVISSLRSAAASDGTHPSGTVYFEDNGDVRSTTRDVEWPATENQLTARNISWIYEKNVSGSTPLNRNNVLAATSGASTLALANGSTYLPGSWADNLTSYGCYFPDTSQTKATSFIAAGAAGTTGSVIEPYAIPQRFTNSSIDTFIADGATLGEAFAKSVATPDVQLPLGDMLAQPLADVPKVVINSGPGNFGTAHGTISIGGSAGLTGARIATGVGTLELLVDGMVNSSGSLAGGSGTFSLDTTGLSDGVHEVRVVAINNAQAASEGYSAEPIVVNNHGRSISFNGGNTTITYSAATFNLAATAGDGTISQVELTCLGRAVAQTSGSPGSLSVSPTSLAQGDNNIVPVAVFSDGSQVAGAAFVVHVESGTTNAWTNGAATALWGNPGNWSGGKTPQNGDGVARFNGPSGGTVTMAGSTGVQELDFGGGNYTLSASPGQTLTMSGSSGPLSQSMINILSGSQTISVPLVFSAPGNLVNVTNATDRLTIAGGISGAGALTVTGSGTLILTGSSTYGGTTNINGGTLQIGPGGTLGAGPIVDNSVLQVNRSDTFALDNSISGNGQVSKNGAGTLILGGCNSYSGGTQVNAGNIVFSSIAALPGSGNVLLNKPGALNVAGAFSTVTEWLNSGKIDSNSTGVLALTGSSNESINMGGYGSLSIGAIVSGVTYSGALTPAGTTFAFGGGGGPLTVASNLTGVNNVAVGSSAPGTVILSGSNSYSGGTQVYSGNIAFASTSSIPASGLILLGSSGALNVTGAYSTVAGWLNSGEIDPASTGVLALTDTSNENINMGGYGGLLLGAAAPGATYGGVLTPMGTTFAFGGGGGTLALTSNLTGANSLFVGGSGPGRLALSGTNTYAGGTTVAGGVLDIVNPWSLPDGGNLTIGNPELFQTQSVAAAAFESATSGEITSQPGGTAVPEPDALLLSLVVGGCGFFWHVVRRSGYRQRRSLLKWGKMLVFVADARHNCREISPGQLF